MHIDELTYDLPEALIAQYPAPERGDSRLMVIEGGGGVAGIASFSSSFPAQLRDDDLVVANNSRVLQARIPVTRPTGGAGEVLLLEPVTDRQWSALARPSRKLQPGTQLITKNGETVTCVEQNADTTWTVELPVAEPQAAAWMLEHGELPLPPYITPNGQSPDRYQTVFSQDHGSVAAPTAGLHFDEELWKQIGERCETATVTLHVGAGTFMPVRDNDLENHDMHAERYEISTDTDTAIRNAMREGRRIVAIGTTTTRVLESVYNVDGFIDSRVPNHTDESPLSGRTRLFIRPGFEFQCVDAMLTNFHLPKSTLLALVMAFAGESTIREAYERAIFEQMRFYSFGDAMFVTRKPVTDASY